MSSAVNKSQKKFMPKVSSRGPGGRAPARRLSTLRASFSVPTAPPSDPASLGKVATAESERAKPTNNHESGTRSQSLGIEATALAQASETVVEDAAAPPAKRVRISTEEANAAIDGPFEKPIKPIGDSNSPVETTAGKPTVDEADVSANDMITPQTTDTANVDSSQKPGSSRALPKPGTTMSEPQLAATNSEPLPRTSSNISTKPAGTASISAPAVVSEPAAQAKPSAPEGYEYIWPEDLPKRRAEERRRKMAVEKEFVAIMRNLYAAKEKERILSEQVGMDEDIAQDMADQASQAATYYQLKQSVGVEAKQQRDAKYGYDNGNGGEAEDENSKTLLDVNKFTMASLCKDIPVGNRNTAYDDYELARVNRRRDTVRVFRAKMWSRRLYEPKESERPALKEAYLKYQTERKERNGKIKTEQDQKITEMDDASESVDSLGGHPQAAIEIQANGSISLVGTQFDRHKNNRTQREGGTSGPKTEVDPTEQVINSYSYSTRERPDRWTPEETTKFYEAVSALGTDFNLIAHLFPMRSRNQIKTKYKYEEKRNPAKLQIHLVSRRKFNVESYSKVSNVAIQDVGTIESELEKVRKEHAEQMKMEEQSRLVAKVEDQQKSTGDPKLPGPKRERRD